jgi:hypothetical protein
MKLAINGKDKFILLETIINYNRLDKDMIGNVMGVYEST